MLISNHHNPQSLDSREQRENFQPRCSVASLSPEILRLACWGPNYKLKTRCLSLVKRLNINAFHPEMFPACLTLQVFLWLAPSWSGTYTINTEALSNPAGMQDRLQNACREGRAGGRKSRRKKSHVPMLAVEFFIAFFLINHRSFHP